MLIQKDTCPCVDRTGPDAMCGLITEMPIPLYRGLKKIHIYICIYILFFYGGKEPMKAKVPRPTTAVMMYPWKGQCGSL